MFAWLGRSEKTCLYYVKVSYFSSARNSFSLLLVLIDQDGSPHLSHGGHVAVAAVVPHHDAVVTGHRAVVTRAAPGHAAAQTGQGPSHGPGLVVEHVHGPADQSEERMKHIDQ